MIYSLDIFSLNHVLFCHYISNNKKMLTGTDLSYAFINDLDPPKENNFSPPQQVVQSKQPVVQQTIENPLIPKESPKMVARDQNPEHMDPSLLTSDQKLYMLSNELKKQKAFYENFNKQNVTYVDKLFSKKKEILKLFTVALIFLLAISMHYVIDYYTKQFFDENVVSATRELIIRILYPFCVLFILWNLKVFNK
jgi:hypothetical protein